MKFTHSFGKITTHQCLVQNLQIITLSFSHYTSELCPKLTNNSIVQMSFSHWTSELFPINEGVLNLQIIYLYRCPTLILLINCVPNQLIIYLNRCPTLIVLLNYVSQLELSTCKDVLLSLYFWSVSQNCQIKTVPRRITGTDLTIEWIFILYFCGNYICLFRIYETWIYRVSAKTLSILLLFIS